MPRRYSVAHGILHVRHNVALLEAEIYGITLPKTLS
jgi:hypothetical protein